MPHCFNPFSGPLPKSRLRRMERTARRIEHSVQLVMLDGGERGHFSMTDYGPPFDAGEMAARVTAALEAGGLWPPAPLRPTLWRVREGHSNGDCQDWHIEARTADSALERARRLVRDDLRAAGDPLPDWIEIHADSRDDARVSAEEFLPDDPSGTLLARTILPPAPSISPGK